MTHMFNYPTPWVRSFAALLLVAVGAGCTSPGGSAPDRAIAAKPAQSNPDQRIALVIGNSKYAESPLINPANDARAMTSTLAGVGFTVTSLYDASLTEMNEPHGSSVTSCAPAASASSSTRATGCRSAATTS